MDATHRVGGYRVVVVKGAGPDVPDCDEALSRGVGARGFGHAAGVEERCGGEVGAEVGEGVGEKPLDLVC
jgi:hypothetical protein